MGTFDNRVTGDNETAILGISERYTGVWGESRGGASGVYGRSPAWHGVFGESDTNTGVLGRSATLYGVHGVSTSSTGTLGQSTSGFGMHGTSASNTGVVGQSTSGVGVEGGSERGDGVVGRGRRGVVGVSETYQGVFGSSRDNAGVVGESESFHAVFGVSRSINNAGLFGGNTGGGWAGIFDGRVSVTGNLYVGGDVRPLGADVAEEFEVETGATVLPGMVVRLGDGGGLEPADRPYETAVIGIVSGAPGFRPAMVLDTGGGGSRLPVALVGKVMCWVDADRGPVRRGDLLTSSPTPGHAMCADAGRGTGSLVGKALAVLTHGQALLPVLTMLR